MVETKSVKGAWRRTREATLLYRLKNRERLNAHARARYYAKSSEERRIRALASREKYRERRRLRAQDRAAKGAALLAEHKALPCMDCGGYFHFSAMDFDHVRGQKAFNVGNARSYAKAKILAEIAKCDVVCANCHRIRTYRRDHERS